MSKDYKLEIGNSSTGDIGLVAYVRARNEGSALRKFKEMFGDECVIELQQGRYYRNVYINPKAICLANIEEAD